MLDASFFSFLGDLNENNYREWFHENKKRYINELKDPFSEFVKKILEELNIDIEAKNCIYRINRDIRFSKDKTPYKTHVSAILSDVGKKDKVLPGFYIQIQQGMFTLGGGCYFLPKEELLMVRSYLVDNYSEFLEILNKKDFKTYFGDIKGDKNKRLPKEQMVLSSKFPLIMNKQFYFMADFPIDILFKDNATIEIAKILNSANDLIVFLNKAITK